MAKEIWQGGRYWESGESRGQHEAAEVAAVRTRLPSGNVEMTKEISQ